MVLEKGNYLMQMDELLDIQTELEKIMVDRLQSDEKISDELRSQLLTDYFSAKNYFKRNIYGEIKAVEKDLTDHSERHIRNVQDNAARLIGDEGKNKYSGAELYFLALSILFHDVGIINGRKGHNKKVTEIYNKIRNNESHFNQERRLILKAVAAHCGESSKSDKDTLNELEEKSDLYGHALRLRELAAVLRFADELAEGPQRTSDYMIENHSFSDGSLIYHEYAQITRPFIDRGGSRIAVSYDIDCNQCKDLKKLLVFTYRRVLKLDLERRYCKYYAPILDVFKRTDVSYEFNYDGNPMELGLDKISLEDKYTYMDVNDNEINKFLERFPKYAVDNILEQINKNEDERNDKSV